VLDLQYDFHSGSGDNGNVYKIVNNRDTNRSQNFLYDDLNRILQAYTDGNSPLTTSWGETFSPTPTNPGVAPTMLGIDAWGNLTNRSAVNGKTNTEGLSCASATTNNQLPTCLGYDAAGNMTSYGTVTYTYDQENHMTKYMGAVTDQYVYDGDGRRVKKNAATVTLYWYDLAGNVLEETSSTGVMQSDYVYFAGKRVARRDADTTVKYYFSDQLGSASVITDAVGTMNPHPLAESDYYPYGGEIPIWSGDSNHYKFTGKERDADTCTPSTTCLDNFGARYYGVSLGRFVTPDWAARPTAVPYAVFGDPRTLNLYNYVENAPLNRADADGHCPWCIPAAVGAVVGGAIEAGIEIYHGEELSGRKIGGAMLGGAIAGGTLGLASGAGLGVTVLAGAVGNTAGGVAERGIATGSASKAFDAKAMVKDAAWGAAAGALAKGGGTAGETLAGKEQLEQLTEKAGWAKLGARHAARVERQRTALAATVRGGEKIGEQVGHHFAELIQKSTTQQPESTQHNESRKPEPDEVRRAH